MVELIPIKGEKDKKMPLSEDFFEKIIDDSEIMEERFFNEGEILGIIERLAQLEKINKKFLLLKEKILDSRGNLIGLSVIVQPERAKLLGWQSINFEYVIKGKHSKEKAEKTFIARIYDLCNPEESRGGIVAEYQNGTWQLTPNIIDLGTNFSE